MPIEIGHEFEKDGKKFCLIDIVKLDFEKYALFSIEKNDKKMDLEFYKITENINGYHFAKVVEKHIINLLFEELERSGNGK